MSGYPTFNDYARAVQHHDSFPSALLRRATFIRHPVLKIPVAATGTSAVVFKVQLDGEEQALRFFTKAHAGEGNRYRDLRAHFLDHGLAANTAMFEWIDNGIRINGRVLPALRMQWVQGQLLNEYVGELVRRQDAHAIGSLAESWRELVERLQRAKFAHGDLQHGNVMVDSAGVFRLVDFDCSWIGRFAGQTPPAETGHRNYQPLRPESRPWGPWMDTFAGLVVYTSLLALSKNPNPWAALNTGENMLFSQDDFRPPHNTPAWHHLTSIGDPQIDRLAGQLKACCARGWTANGGLADLLAQPEQEVPWWERTGTPPIRTGERPPVPDEQPTRPHRTRAAGEDWWTVVTPPSGIPTSGTPRTPPATPTSTPSGTPSTGGAVVGGIAIGVLAAILMTIIIASNGGAAIGGPFIGAVVGLVAFLVLINRRK